MFLWKRNTELKIVNGNGFLKAVLALVLIFLLCLGTVFFYRYIFYLLFPGTEHTVSSSVASYRFDADTIFESLPQNKTAVFTLQDDLSEKETATPPASTVPVQWGEAEYFQVGEAFHEFIWKEPTSDWKLRFIAFDMNCENVGRGFDGGSFVYYKTEHVYGEDETRFVHDLSIWSPDYFISSYQKELYPVREQWDAIDLEEVNISVEQALAIAEKNGGYDARLAVENACKIEVSIKPVNGYDAWNVRYYGINYKPYFIIDIDKQTGEYRVVYGNDPH